MEVEAASLDRLVEEVFMKWQLSRDLNEVREYLDIQGSRDRKCKNPRWEPVKGFAEEIGWSGKIREKRHSQ